MKNIEALRIDTPGVNKVIHFNNAGSSLPTNSVVNAFTNYLKEESLYGGYEIEAKKGFALNKIYIECAKLLNCSPKEIAYTDSATTSWQRAFFSIDWKDGDEIITGNAEYASNFISFLRLQKLFQIKVNVAEDNEYGETDGNCIEKLINQNTKLVAITHMPTSGGLVNPIEEIGVIANKHKILYLVDACQSVGQYPLDVKKIQCDFLSGTGRKYLRAPRGTGILYVKNELIDRLKPFSLDLSSSTWDTKNSYKMVKSAKIFETYEVSYAAKLATAEALRYANELGIENICERVQHLASVLRSKLKELDFIEVRDTGRVQSGIVTFTHKKLEPGAIQSALLDKGINVSTIKAQNSRLYMEHLGINHLVRSSIHYYNTEEEIDKFIAVLKSL